MLLNLIAASIGLFSSLASTAPQTYPIFLKYGSSCILEFEKAPRKAVLDPANFQVERIGTSLVITPLTSAATSSLFVSFLNLPMQIFQVTTSEDAVPTVFRSFKPDKPVDEPIRNAGANNVRIKAGLQVRSAKFSKRMDYLTIDFLIHAGSQTEILPKWNSIVIRYGSHFYKPSKIWAQRRLVVRDATVLGRLVFTRVNLPKSLKDVELAIPLKKEKRSLVINLGGSQK